MAAIAAATLGGVSVLITFMPGVKSPLDWAAVADEGWQEKHQYSEQQTGTISATFLTSTNKK